MRQTKIKKYSIFFLCLCIGSVFFLTLQKHPEPTYYYADGNPDNTYDDTNTATLNTSVARGSRPHFTQLKGDGTDTATVLIYMIGSDLESEQGLATADLNEILYADSNKNVNVLLQTGGTTNWQNSSFQSNTIQRWKVSGNTFECLSKDTKDISMADSSTLSSFLRWGTTAYPADRYDLIFWDHGGTSPHGFGFDETYPKRSLRADTIAKALQDSGVHYDFIGFDAGLTATIENAIAIAPYADYMIASEAIEQAKGWYYTSWLTSLYADPSIPTLSLGKVILDSYALVSMQENIHDRYAMSFIDLSEIDTFLPHAIEQFGSRIQNRIENGEYKKITNARQNTQEFSSAYESDQIDLCDFALELDDKDLAKVLLSSVKYRRTANMPHANGLSAYVPFHDLTESSSLYSLFHNLHVGSEYMDSLRLFSLYTAIGRIASSHTSPPFISLLKNEKVTIPDLKEEELYQLCTDTDALEGQFGTNILWDKEDIQKAVSYVHREKDSTFHLSFRKQDIFFQTSNPAALDSITITPAIESANGYVLLGEQKFKNTHALKNIPPTFFGKWIHINGHPAFLYQNPVEDPYILGYVPAILNAKEVYIPIEIKEDGYQATHAIRLYPSQIQAKGTIPLRQGDTITLLGERYQKNGEQKKNIPLSPSFTIQEELIVQERTLLSSSIIYSYRYRNLYGQEQNTPFLSYERTEDRSRKIQKASSNE